MRIGTLLIVLLAPVGAFGAEPIPLTLTEALDLAAHRNPDLLAQAERADSVTAQRNALLRMRWPRLAISSGWSRADTPSMVFAGRLDSGEFRQEDFAIDRLNDPAALSHLTTALAAEVPIDAFGKIGARAEALSLAAGAAGAGRDEGSQEMRLRVIESYRRAVLGERVVEVSERALESAKAREADVEARVTEGAALTADLLRARARRRQREAELAERRADQAVALAYLARAIGADSSESYRPFESPPAPAALEGDAASWTARALADRPALHAARRSFESQAWLVRAEERSRWPDLAAWGRLQDDRIAFSGGARSGAFGLSLRWSAFDPSHSARVAAASSEARAAELTARATSDQVRLETETAWRRAQAARDRHAAAAGGAEEGREALRVVRERRQQGMATLTDELETESASLAAELEELRAATDAALADAALRRAAGAL